MQKTEHYESSIKDKFQRQPATENRGKSYKTAMVLPSKKATDVNEGFANGILTQVTKLLAVEKDTHIRKKAIKQLKKLTKNYHMIGKQFHDVKLSQYLEKDEKIDYLLFDICGNYTAQLAGWFYRNQKHFIDGMRLPMTLCANTRHKELDKAVLSVAKVTGYAKIKALIKSISDKHFPWGMSEQMYINIETQILMIILSMPNKHIEFHKLNIYANSDKSTNPTYMMFLDVSVYDAAKDDKNFRKFERIIDKYNYFVESKSKVTLDDMPKKIKKISQTTYLTRNYAERLDIQIEKDLKKLNSPGVKAAITRWAEKYNTTPQRIVGGIRRSITCKAK